MSDEKPGSIKIDGKVYAIPDDYKISEMELLEERTGKDSLGEIDFSSSKAIKAVVLILLRRENPDYDEAQLGDVTVSLDVEDDADPPAEPLRSVSGAQR